MIAQLQSPLQGPFKDIHVPLRRVNENVLRRRGISADSALRLARYFNTTPVASLKSAVNKLPWMN